MKQQPAGISDQDARVILTALETFCRTAGARCYGAFAPEVLRDYLAFHLTHGTLAWVRETDPDTPGGWRITGVAVAWQGEPEAWFAQMLQTRCVFAWQPTNPAGRALFIADVVATNPGALAALLQRWHTLFPQWRTQPIYTVRRGRMVYLTARQLLRLWRRAVHQMKGT